LPPFPIRMNISHLNSFPATFESTTTIRPRRDSRQQNGITVRRVSQATSATESANSRHSR
jgi:hypothetical protein